MSHPVDDLATASTTGRGFRASDADRQLTVMVLQDAVSRGLLTPEEGSERMAAAWAATHHEELPPLTADLPPTPAERPGRAGRNRTGPAPLVSAGGAKRSGTDWRSRGLALWSTVLTALSALVGMVGGTGRHRRLRLVVAALVVVFAVSAVLWLGGHLLAGPLFSDGDVPRGGGRMGGGPGSGR